MKYSVVLPCFNESANINILVDRFRPFSQKWDFELILVNNGSTDDSAEVLDKIQAENNHGFIRVVTIDKNIGYGHGIHAGLSAASGEILAYTHADAQTPPEDIFRGFELIESGQVNIREEIIKGHRPGRDDSHVLTRWLRIITKGLTGLSVEDINGQPKIFHRELFQEMGRPSVDFSYDTYVLYIASRKGLGITPMDVSFEQRLHGQSKWASSIFKKYKTIAAYLCSIFMVSWRDKDNFNGQIMRFGLSGTITNITNYVTFLLLLWYLMLGLFSSASNHHIYASVAGFFAGFVVGFFLNRNLVFGAKDGKIHADMSKFLIVNIISLGANVAMIFMAVNMLGIDPKLGQILAILVSAVVNFCGTKWWVFAK